MTSGLEQKWIALEEAKERMIALLQSMQNDQLYKKPNEDSWNMIQVVEHILFSEGGTVMYMCKKSSSGWDVLENEGEQESTNGAALVNRLASDEKYKAPAILPSPQGEASLEELIKKWEAIRVDFKNFLEDFDPQYSNKLVFKQPYAGMITLGNALLFLTEHINHHMPQLRSLATLS